VNVLEGTVGRDGAIPVGRWRMPLAPGVVGEGSRVRVAVRTGDVDLFAADEEEANATVVRIADLGGRIQLEAAVDEGPTLRAHVARHALRAIAKGTRVRVEARVQRVYAM
jgi:ABC-type sulfate/molybdate transport systems ATPase subunit